VNIAKEGPEALPIDEYFRFTTGRAAWQGAPEDPLIISQVP
jgi:hypothetical protein